MKPRRQEYRKLINSARWRRTRTAALRRAGYVCEDCSLRGMVALATEVHHIRPVEWARDDRRREQLMFDPSNLVALCHRCHVERHRSLGSHSAAARAARDDADTAARYEALFRTGDDSAAAPHPGGCFLNRGEGG